MNHRRRNRLITGALLLVLALLSGCATIGPGKVPLDRASYNSSITESWKEQLLLNIVKIRYVEPLFFVDIGDIVAAYTLETGANMDFSRSLFDLATSSDSSLFGLGVSGKYTDRPTITYKPMTGAPFRKGVMSPLPLRSVALGIESGISANFLVSLGVRAVNGQRNEALSPQGHVMAQSGFQRVVELLSQLQLANGVHVRSESQPGAGDPLLFLSLGGRNPSAEVLAMKTELLELLDLDATQREYELSTVPDPRDRTRISLQTFSLLQIMAALAARVDIPEKDIVEKCAMPSLAGAPTESVLGEVSIRCAKLKPSNAYAAVKFHGHWFWVSDNDLATKRVFSFLMLAFTMMEDSGKSAPLQLTLPVQ